MKQNQLISFKGQFNFSDKDLEEAEINLEKVCDEVTRVEQQAKRRSYYQYSEVLNDVKRASRDDSNVLGVLADLVFVEENSMERCLAHLLGPKMISLIFRDSRSMLQWEQKINMKTGCYPLLYLSDIRKQIVTSDGKIDFGLKIPEVIDGFCGFACNLFEFRSKSNHNELRLILAAACGETMVFKSFDNALAYREHMDQKDQYCPTLISLDDKKIGNTSFKYIGKDSMIEPNCYFGRAPLCDNEKYKNLLTQKQRLRHGQVIKAMSLEMEQKKKQLEQDKRLFTVQIEQCILCLQFIQNRLCSLEMQVKNGSSSFSNIGILGSIRQKRNLAQVSDADNGNDRNSPNKKQRGKDRHKELT